MVIREIRRSDIAIAREIHEKYYREEFIFPNFYYFSSAWTILKDNVPIIVGGIKPIAEAIIITNKDFNQRDRREALHMNLQASCEIGKQCGFDQIHCAIQEPVYERHLKKIGFRPVKGSFLVYDI